jgi:PAS domain S-box-containing protein
VTPALLTVIAHATSLQELLPQLHRHALDATKGRCSLLLEQNPHNGAWHVTSSCGLDPLPAEPWLPTASDEQILSNASSSLTSTGIADLRRQLPGLAMRTGTAAALLFPLNQRGERIGLLAIGVEAAPVRTAALAEIGDAFVTAIELFRLRQSESLQHDVRIVVDEFSATVDASLNIASGLDSFCAGTNRLFRANRTSLWVHDRRARRLMLHASSDASRAAVTVVAADDPTSLAAVAMRRARAGVLSSDDPFATSIVLVPLRGCRRALGALVIEGARLETGGELAVLDRAEQLGHHLSSAMENLQLLDDLARSRRELENTFDSITHLVAVWDRRGRIAHVNHAFASRVGFTRDELLERPFDEFVGPELRHWLTKQAADEELSANGAAPVTIEVLDPILKGPFMVTVTALRNHERERVGSVLVARDLTAQARMQEEREELRRRLNQSEKLVALGQFVAGIAHELNNPLQGVLGHLELLRATGAFPRKLRREVQTIYREADRAAKIVRNLLAFSGSRRLVRRAVSINAVLQKVLAIRASACRAANIEVVRHYDAKLPRVQSDSLLLHQVFFNIVMNAEHAIAQGGHGGRIEIMTTVARSGDRVVVSVRDTGEGIPADVVSRIFEPFYTTKEVGQGSGLGLAITYGIVQEHGGEIVAANHPDGGAVFTIELPIHSTPHAETEAAVIGLNRTRGAEGREGPDA